MKYEPLKKVYYTNENGYELEYSKRYAAPFTQHFDMPIKEYNRKNTYSAFLIYTQEIALLMEQIYKSYETLLYVIHSVPKIVLDQFALVHYLWLGRPSPNFVVSLVHSCAQASPNLWGNLVQLLWS